MKKLAISIPNYNRIEKLQKLVSNIINQIQVSNLENIVQLCISDDASRYDPSDMINAIKIQFPEIDIKYERKSINQGMDYNFLNCVLMADTEYCWIVGNDDFPLSNSIQYVVDYLNIHSDADFIVTPFDIFSENGEYRSSLNPLDVWTESVFDTHNENEKTFLLKSINHNSGIFGFLSNVIFRKKYWENNKNKYLDRMDSLFIQMYMNIGTLLEGAVYYYLPVKLIKNFADDTTNVSVERVSRILFGLDGVAEYFFDGELKKHFKKVLTDAYISGTVWHLPNSNFYKQKLLQINSEKNLLYKKYYIMPDQCKKVLENEKIIIYGSGDYGNRTYQELKKRSLNVIAIADSDRKKTGKPFEDMFIINIKDVVDNYSLNAPYVIVANYFHLCDMVYYLQNNGVKKIGILL